MKAKIVYYSFSGNTKSVSETLKAYLENKGYQVEMLRLEPLDEVSFFFGQCQRALAKKRAQLKPLNFDVSGYDLVVLGTPVWAFGPAPAVNTFLDNISGLKDKRAIVFTTCGSGAGNNRCLDYMKETLMPKGASQIQKFSVQQFKVKDKGFIESKVKELV